MSNPSIGVATPHDFEVYAQQIELRISALERELRELKTGAIDSSSVRSEVPWWEKIAGSCADNPLFDDAVRYGQEWRNSPE